MIQELLGGSSVGIIGGERSKLSDHPPCGGGGGGGGGILDHGSPSPSPSVSPSPSSSSSAAAAAVSAAVPENLRCPRCDSSNTKFCYYNNYNLTQPRHFCKTCRRYWTKGGALRNVPIGGGCRKNKSTIITAAVASKSGAAAKFKTASSEMGGKAGLFAGFEHGGEALSSNPILWASSQNSHFLSLIRANQTLNPSHLTSSAAMKDEASPFSSPHLSSDTSSSAPNARALGLDHLGLAHFPPMGHSNSLYRNQTLASHGILQGEVQNHGLQELYHRLRLYSSSSSSNCYPDHAPVVFGNMASATSSATTAILESGPVAATEMGFWNSNISWPADLSTANGSYP